ncbi:calcium-binding protein [Mesorhizobium sp. LHD-90]|uniref:calcium-binding protein n=1 Tax=Mesorhizobium sp. LHD-90 TaxID=3071414 RepID=UPI0027E164CA|nr:calcium-binding protein [Mesorhizobium sp. LHD-90]MDQ6432509.1 calcium-binding protein [Mesorhizobium sp. LHD-90]
MQNIYMSMYGTKGNDTVVLNHAAVADWEHSGWDPNFGFVNTLWVGYYHAGEGNDAIIRDRPGMYRLGWDGSGDAYMFGGSGTDTISYAHYTGAIDIDLSTSDGHGLAKAKGVSGQTILGDDVLYSFENATGTNGSDIIRGSNGVNTLVGGNGHDEMHGEGGNDKLFGGNHNDKLYGGSGNDTIKGESGNDTAHGGANDDIIEGGSGNDTLKGDDGKDFLYGGSGHNVLWGGNGNDTLLIEGSGRAFGDAGDDILVGGASDDELHGGTEADTLTGLAGNDELYGDLGDDNMLGGDGNDTLEGGNGQDVIHGGNGNDFVIGGHNSDDLRGGEGIDTAAWEGSARVVIDLRPTSVGTAVQYSFTDSLAGFENFRTGSGNDWISTNGTANYVDAGDGNDYVNAGSGNDAVLAGKGNDGVRGGQGNDSILAGDGDDWLWGDAGNDTLSGGDGEDLVRGGSGTDILFGGNDADQFVFAAGDSGIDSIRDFVLGEDMVRFDDFLADEPEIGESYVGRVYAASADMGHSTMLVAMTDDGWQAFAKIVGNGNVASFNAAIADGGLFNPSMLNGDSPMDIII